MALYKDGAFVPDPWAAREILSVADLTERQAGTRSPLGIRLDPGFAVETIADMLPEVSLIAIAFPRFTDGRGYSMGWLLRTRFGYSGEMRAIGDVLFDEMQFMGRCGFNAFEIVDKATIELLEGGRSVASFDRFYQPGLEAEIPAGTRPWARRSRAVPSGNQA